MTQLDIKALGLSLLLLAGIVEAADTIPPELQRLIPAGTTLLTHQTSDLNGDGRPDYVFIVEKQSTPGKATDEDNDEGVRILYVAVRQGDGNLKVVKRNERVVYCRQCGGVFGDPFENLDTGLKGFSVSHYGGSNWRWSNTFSFAYSRKDNTWQLVEVEESSFHTSNPDKMKSRSYRPPRDFGKIDIADFDPEKFRGVGPR